MTARKTTKKAGTSVRKKTGKATKAATKKKAPARKAGAAKKASPTRASKASAATKKKAAPKKALTAKPAAKVAKPPPAASAPVPKPDAPRAATSALNVNMGHIFGLRPKANTSFRPGDLVEARQRLKDESYETLTDAARAVAEKALDLTHESGARRGHKKRR